MNPARTARETLGLTTAELAELLGLSARQVRYMELGYRQPSHAVATLLRLMVHPEIGAKVAEEMCKPNIALPLPFLLPKNG